jgi:hypothetical protein
VVEILSKLMTDKETKEAQEMREMLAVLYTDATVVLQLPCDKKLEPFSGQDVGIKMESNFYLIDFVESLQHTLLPHCRPTIHQGNSTTPAFTSSDIYGKCMTSFPFFCDPVEFSLEVRSKTDNRENNLLSIALNLSKMGRSASNHRTEQSSKRQRIHEPRKQKSNDGSICCWMDCESLETIDDLKVSAPTGSIATIHTPIASATSKEIFMNRLQQEVLLPFRYSLSSQIQLLDSDQTIYDATNRRKIIQRRILCGYNAVSNVLFEYSKSMIHGRSDHRNEVRVPRLIVLVNIDDNDELNSRLEPSMLQHIVLLTHELNIPLLLLPSSTDYADRSSSEEPASLFGASSKFLHVIAFVSQGSTDSSHDILQSVDRLNETGAVNKSFKHSSDKRIHETIDSFIEFIRGKTMT